MNGHAIVSIATAHLSLSLNDLINNHSLFAASSGWDQWSNWSECDEVTQMMYRKRTCTKFKPDECVGNATESQRCHTNIMPNGMEAKIRISSEKQFLIIIYHFRNPTNSKCQRVIDVLADNPHSQYGYHGYIYGYINNLYK